VRHHLERLRDIVDLVFGSFNNMTRNRMRAIEFELILTYETAG
jgi:hypothetical protein